jgi:hypothetical protein
MAEELGWSAEIFEKELTDFEEACAVIEAPR